MTTVMEMLDLSTRVAVITGGGGFIGRRVASALVECGADVVLLDVNESATESAAALIEAEAGRRVMCSVCDVADEASAQQAIDDVLRQFGRLDILVNNAAYPPTGEGVPRDGLPLDRQGFSLWKANIKVVADGTFLMTRAAVAALRASRVASVINIASVYGIVGPQFDLYDGCPEMGNPAYYAMAKGGIIQLTRYLASNLAPDIRVNAISPGGVLRGQPEAFRSRYEQRVPMRRLAVEEDLVGAVVFLASDLSRYVTGHNLVVDGGWTAV